MSEPYMKIKSKNGCMRAKEIGRLTTKVRDAPEMSAEKLYAHMTIRSSVLLDIVALCTNS